MSSTHWRLALLLLYSTASHSQNLIVAVTPADRQEVQVYQEASRQSPGRTLLTTALSLPLAILETRNGFHRIDVEGQMGWLSTMQVRIRRDNQASCIPNSPQLDRNSATISTPGIGASACK